MRQQRTVQASLFDRFAEHEIGRELKAMSAWLDEHRNLIGLVASGLSQRAVKQTGRQGLPAEAALRCALLKQYRQLSYEELAHLEDSASFRAFARLPFGFSPKKSVLHKTIGAIRGETWETINRALLASARNDKLEDGRVVRLDSTVTAAPIHPPSDSSLLCDAVRVMVRLLKAADRLGGYRNRAWRDQRRAAKKRLRAIEYGRGRQQRVAAYRDLLEITRNSLAYLQQAGEALAATTSRAAALWRAEVARYRPLIEKVIAQTERRVLAGEAVPAADKVVSLFEPHTDILPDQVRDQGPPRRRLRPQAQPDHRKERPHPRPRGRGWQSGRQRAARADAARRVEKVVRCERLETIGLARVLRCSHAAALPQRIAAKLRTPRRAL